MTIVLPLDPRCHRKIIGKAGAGEAYRTHLVESGTAASPPPRAPPPEETRSAGCCWCSRLGTCSRRAGSDRGSGVSEVKFYYSMYGATMGTLSLVNALGSTLWQQSGNKGNLWNSASVSVSSASFRFEYARGASYTGDAALDDIAVTCTDTLQIVPPSTLGRPSSSGATLRTPGEGGGGLLDGVEAPTRSLARRSSRSALSSAASGVGVSSCA